MSIEVRDDLKYTESHEWIKIEGNKVRVGVTDHAQSELTDVVFVELPEIGKEIKKGDELCVVESVKSVSEVFSPISGKIININKNLEDSPELINKSPYDDGWLIEAELTDKSETENLLNAQAYRNSI
jgi:glycine cleavage system H protein